MRKESIRKRILSLRNRQPLYQAMNKSFRIQKRLFTSPEFVKAKTILFYVATKDEVKTESMIKKAIEYGKRVVVPISNVKKKTLSLSELRSFNEELKPGAFNILEPKEEFIRPVSPEEIDLVIVPGVAFDEKGNRIGYGMGFYDRFLKTVRKDTPVIGLAYNFQIVDEIPIDDKDVTVDKVVTEERIVECLNI